MAGNGGIRWISVWGKTSTLLYPSSSAKEQLDRKIYDACPGAPEPDDQAKFTTHGLAMRAVRNSIYTLYAIHHGKRESIEVFQADARRKTPVLTWIGCAHQGLHPVCRLKRVRVPSSEIAIPATVS